MKQNIVEATAYLAQRSKIRMAIAVFLIHLATVVLGCDFEWGVNGEKMKEWTVKRGH
jgi:hypothetical protein